MKELVVKLRVDGSGVFPAFATLEKRANNLAAGSFSRLKAAIGGAFAVGAIVAAGKRTMEWAGHLTDVATRLGVSTEWVQEMTYALKQSGASMEDLVSFTEKLNKARAEALSGSAAGQKISGILQTQFGVDATMLKGPVQPIIDAIAKSFESGNVQQLTAAMMQMGIKGAGAMAAAFADGLQDGRQQIRAAGGVASEDVIEQLDAAGDAIQTLATIMQSQLAPAIVAVARAVVSSVGWIKSSSAFIGAGTAQWSLGDWVKKALSAATPQGAITTALGMTGGKVFDYARAGQSSQEVDNQFSELLKSFDAKNSNRIERRKRSGLGEFDFEPEEGKAAKSKRGKADVADSLIAVGNFLGSGGSAIEKIGNETNRLLRLIQQDLKNFKPSNKEYTDDLGIP